MKIITVPSQPPNLENRKPLPEGLWDVVRLQGLSPLNKALCRYYRGKSRTIKALIVQVSHAKLDWESVGINPDLGAKVVALRIYNAKMNGQTPGGVGKYNESWIGDSLSYTWWDELHKRPISVIREIFKSTRPRTIHRWGNAVAMIDEWKEKRA
jgi:hypothetical protein